MNKVDSEVQSEDNSHNISDAEILSENVGIDDLASRVNKVRIFKTNEVVTSIKITGRASEVTQPTHDLSDFLLLSFNWMQSCLGLIEALPLYNAVAHFVHLHQVEEEVVAFAERKSSNTKKEVQEDGKKVETIYEIDERFTYEMNKRFAQLNQYKRAEKSFTKAQLLAIVSEYEAFIGDLIRLAIRRRPEAFISSDAKVSVYDVIKGESLESVKELIIEDRIESIQRESHVEQIKFLLGKLKLPLPDPKTLREFGEICERRNVVTHGRGVANKIYTSKLRELGIPENEIPKIGSELSIDPRYLKRSLARVFQMGFFTLHIVWQHLEPENSKKSVSSLIDASHDFLVAGYTKISGRISEFILNPKSPATEVNRAYSIINLALSVYLNDAIQEPEKSRRVEEILSKRDWAIVGPLLNLALSCVRGKHDDLGRQIDLALEDGLTEHNLLTWALFSKARNERIFREKIKERFGIEIESGGESEPVASGRDRPA